MRLPIHYQMLQVELRLSSARLMMLSLWWSRLPSPYSRRSRLTACPSQVHTCLKLLMNLTSLRYLQALKARSTRISWIRQRNRVRKSLTSRGLAKQFLMNLTKLRWLHFRCLLSIRWHSKKYLLTKGLESLVKVFLNQDSQILASKQTLMRNQVSLMRSELIYNQLIKPLCSLN